MRQLITAIFAAVLAVALGCASAPKPTTVDRAATPADPAGASAKPAADTTSTPTDEPSEPAGDDEPATSTTAASLATLLDEEKLDYQQDDDRLRHTYFFTDKRSQQVFLQPQSDVREVGVVEIYSWVMELQDDLTLEQNKRLLERLLEVNGEQKLGYFGVEEVEGKTYVFCYHNLPTQGLTSKALAATLISVAEMADEMEKEQLGASSDEY